MEPATEAAGPDLAATPTGCRAPEPSAGGAHGGARWLNGLAAPLVGIAFVLLLLAFHPFRDVFQFDPDEGNNVIKALMVDRGYHLYSEVWNDQPPLFTYMLVGWFRLFGWDVEAARLLVLVCAALLVAATYDLLRVTWGHRAALCGAALLPCSSLFVRLSVSIMLGLPAVMLAVVSLWALCRWWRSGRWVWVSASGAAFALSVLTKLFTAFLAPLLGAAVLIVALRRADAGRRWWRALLPPLVWSAALAAVALLIVALTVPLGSLDQLYEPHVKARAELQGATFLKQFAGDLQRDWAIGVLAVLGCAWTAARRRWLLAVMPLWGALAFALLIRHAPLWYHHYLLLSVPACLLAGIAAGETFSRGWIPRRSSATCLGSAARVAGAVLIVSVLVGLVRNPPGRGNLTERRDQADRERFVVSLMRAYQPHVSLALVDMQMFAFAAGYPVPPNLTVTSVKRFVTGNLTVADVLRELRERQPGLVVVSWRWVPLRAPWQAVVDAVRGRYALVYSDEELSTRVYARRDLPVDPLEAVRAACAAWPDVAQGQAWLGALLAQRGRRKEALDALRHAHALDASEPRACVGLATELRVHHEYDEAFAILRAAVDQLRVSAHSDTTAQWRFQQVAPVYAWWRATCPDETQRNGAVAEDLARLLLRAQPAESQALEILAAALAAQGRFTEADAEMRVLLSRTGGRVSQEDLARYEQQRRAYLGNQAWVERLPAE